MTMEKAGKDNIRWRKYIIISIKIPDWSNSVFCQLAEVEGKDMLFSSLFCHVLKVGQVKYCPSEMNSVVNYTFVSEDQNDP